MNLSSFYKKFKPSHFDWFGSSSVKKDLNITLELDIMRCRIC